MRTNVDDHGQKVNDGRRMTRAEFDEPLNNERAFALAVTPLRMTSLDDLCDSLDKE